VLRALRELCAGFRLPPRFRLLEHDKNDVRSSGVYDLDSDTVSMDPDRAAAAGMGGEEGYYAALTHELLHATGHPSRLNGESIRDESDEGEALEEGTVMAAERIVLEAVGFPLEALDWFAPCRWVFVIPSGYRLDPAPVDRDAARAAADWVLNVRSS
jgi:antirestriction protein ArdC